MPEPVSKPLHEFRPPRVVHAAALTATLALMGGLAWYLFFRRGPIGETPDQTLRIMSGAILVAGVFLSGVFLTRLIARPASFWCTEEGFVYQPGGVSTGLIRWSEVKALRHVGVQTAAQSYENAVAVELREPERFVARQVWWLQPLFRLRTRFSGTPLVLRRSDLGPGGADVMAECLRRAQAR